MNHSTLCVGADVHLDEIVLCVVDKADGHEVIEPFRVTNNLPGAQAAATAIAETAARLGCTRIEIGWEATGMLWIPFHRYLRDCPSSNPLNSSWCVSTPNSSPSSRMVSSCAAQRTTSAMLRPSPPACASESYPSPTCLATSGKDCVV